MLVVLDSPVLGHDDCLEDNVGSCDQNGACDGAGECALYPDGEVCDEGQICIEQSCEPGCFSNLHCPDGERCNSDGQCEAPLEEGEPLGCAPCALMGSSTGGDAGWWWLIAGALLHRRRRSSRPLSTVAR